MSAQFSINMRFTATTTEPTSTPGRSFSTRQRDRHSRGAENAENDESSHRDLMLKYLFGVGYFLEIAYLFVDIRKRLPGKSFSVR